ncbi:MAG TPA: hypothetical protein VFW09_17850 [Solirubrobacteraceae bacterium]|nr:hypothetical protein [Solirubrobacteraceae bacterium]
MRRLVILSALALLAVPSTALGRKVLHGNAKYNAIWGAYHTEPSNRGDRWVSGARVPRRILVNRCMTVVRSTVNPNWAIDYFSGGTGQLCLPVASNGWGELNVERWNNGDGTSSWYWTSTSGSSESPCGERAYVGEPRMPRRVVNDIFHTHCPRDGRISLPR